MLLEIITRREVSSAQPNPFDCAKGRPFNRSIAQGAANVRGYNCIPHCFERRNSHCPCNGRLPTLDLGRSAVRSYRDGPPFWQWDMPDDSWPVGTGGCPAHRLIALALPRRRDVGPTRNSRRINLRLTPKMTIVPARTLAAGGRCHLLCERIDL